MPGGQFFYCYVQNFGVCCVRAGELAEDCNDSDNTVLSFLRKSPSTGDIIACIFNFNPVPKHNYKIGVPKKGLWKEILNSDSECYFGSNIGNLGEKYTYDYSTHARPYTLEITVPPLAAVFFKYDNTKREDKK